MRRALPAMDAEILNVLSVWRILTLETGQGLKGPQVVQLAEI
jgi:hypothetical protein